VKRALKGVLASPVTAGYYFRPASSLDALPLTTAARRILSGELVKRRGDGEVDRSASLLQMARVLAGTGMDPLHFAATLAERDLALGWRKYIDREDAQRQYERLATLVTRPTR